MRQIEGWCAWCGERFLYTPSGPNATLKRFCGKKHRDRANNARVNLRANLADGVCPTPTKRIYLTRRAAESVLIKKPAKHRGAAAYECPCGFWHIGHIPKGIHSPERMEEQRKWLALSEEQRQAIREKAYADKMARRSTGDGGCA